MRAAALIAALGALLVAPAAHAAGRCGDHPWCDTGLDPDTRAGLLLAQMTLDEKISLMDGDEPSGVLTASGGVGHIGTSRGIPRLDVPDMLLTDGPAGVRQGPATGMPAPMGLAATFDEEVARRHGAVIGNEAKLKGNDVVHAPTVNVMRTPLGGRTFEGYGEDPFLVSRIAVGWIEGAQSEGVIGNVKHFAANNQEPDRFVTNAVVDERTLREIYLPHFEASVKEANVGTVMCAYNRLNGQKACENGPLLEGILRREWGFRGFVLSDYGFAVSSTEGAANGGLELELPQGPFFSPPALRLAVEASRVSTATIDTRVRNILRTMFAYGMFDRDAYPEDDRLIDKAGHADAARAIEEEAIVLMRNTAGALPLDASKLRSLAVIGADADEYKKGGGSSNVTPFAFTTPRQGIERRAGDGVDVRYDPGGDPSAAAETARGADAAIVVVSDDQTEFVDKPCLSLQCGNPRRGDQDGLVRAVAAANERTIVVLETGGPVLLPWAGDVEAIVEAWYPGGEGGTALARVLFGDADPGGRLPVTFPKREGDIPTAGDPRRYPGVAENAYYEEGVFVGYRHFDEQGIEPLFPFGSGLSYTSFAFGDLRLERGAVSAVVRNTGPRAGTEVAQLYLGLLEPNREVQQPPWQLKGIAKVRLRPGESRRVRFALPDRAFSYWDTAAHDWRVAPGCHRVAVGRSSRELPLRALIDRGGACGDPTAFAADRAATAPCDVRRAFRSARARVAGGRLRLRFPRHAGRTPVAVDVFQTSVGPRVVGERRIFARRTSRDRLTWSGRRARDGVLFARVRAGGESRRFALRRRGGRLRLGRPFERRDGCGLLRRAKLERPAFGGRTRRPLSLAYRVGEPARVTVRLQGRTYRLGRRRPGVTYRLRIAPRRVRRGERRLVVEARAGGRVAGAALTARRL